MVQFLVLCKEESEDLSLVLLLTIDLFSRMAVGALDVADAVAD